MKSTILILLLLTSVLADLPEDQHAEESSYYGLPLALIQGSINRKNERNGISQNNFVGQDQLESRDGELSQPRLFLKKKFLLLKKLFVDKPAVITIPQPVPIPIPVPQPYPPLPPTGTGTGTVTGTATGTATGTVTGTATGTDASATGTATGTSTGITATGTGFRTQDYEYVDDETESSGSERSPQGFSLKKPTGNKPRRKINRRNQNNNMSAFFQQYFPEYQNFMRKKANQNQKKRRRPINNNHRRRNGGNRPGNRKIKKNRNRVKRPQYVVSQT